MSDNFYDRLNAIADNWRSSGLERKLSDPSGIDFSSNDYLDLSKNPSVVKAAIAAIEEFGCGAPSARLLRGNYRIHQQVEASAAQLVGTESALLFPSGWQANAAVLSALATKDDVLICDELIHASLIDGARLSRAAVKVFKHNDLQHLEARLVNSQGMHTRFVVIEDVYSMDGDRTPLAKIIELCEKHDAYIILDLAHSVGLYPPRFCESTRIISRTITGGKALGVGGGIICASSLVVNHLLNHARGFLFTTAIPPATCGALQRSMQLLAEQPDICNKVHQNAAYLREQLSSRGYDCPGETPILPMIIGDTQATIDAANQLQQRGFDVRAIRPPTVALGSSRLRIVVRASHTQDQLDNLANAITDCVSLKVDASAATTSQLNDILVVGTDTGVGKTVVSALLMRAAKRFNIGAKYFKPVQTGNDSDTLTVKSLAGLDDESIEQPLLQLQLPASVDQAAAAEGVRACINQELPKIKEALAANEATIIETAGGLLVPWNDSQDQGDLAQRLATDAVLVTRTSLGTLNHTLLTIEALAKRGIKLKAIFMAGDPHSSNKNSLLDHTVDVPIFEFPFFKNLGPESLDFWIETEDLEFLFNNNVE